MWLRIDLLPGRRPGGSNRVLLMEPGDPVGISIIWLEYGIV